MCTIVNYQPCHHYRWFLKPDYSKAYSVKKITGNICSPVIEVSTKINRTTEVYKIKTVKEITKDSGKIYVEVVGNYDQSGPCFMKITIQTGDNLTSYNLQLHVYNFCVSQILP